MAQTNADGWTLVKCMALFPHVITVHKNQYAFVVKRAINCAWIRPEDLDAVMSITRQCCGGQRHPKYTLANERDEYWWTL